MFLVLAVCSFLAVEVLDIEMNNEEKKQIGLAKLTDKEKSQLQTWIDNNYLKRPVPLAVNMAAKEYKSLMQDNLNNGTYIRLSDNSVWNIRPTDVPISSGWITPVDIIVTQSGDPNYPYKLTNTLSGSSVFARKAASTPASGNSQTPSPAPQAPSANPPAQKPSKEQNLNSSPVIPLNILPLYSPYAKGGWVMIESSDF